MRINKELEELRTQIVNEPHGTLHEATRDRVNLLIRRLQWIEWAKNYYKSEIRRTMEKSFIKIYQLK